MTLERVTLKQFESFLTPQDTQTYVNLWYCRIMKASQSPLVLSSDCVFEYFLSI